MLFRSEVKNQEEPQSAEEQIINRQGRKPGGTIPEKSRYPEDAVEEIYEDPLIKTDLPSEGQVPQILSAKGGRGKSPYYGSVLYDGFPLCCP